MSTIFEEMKYKNPQKYAQMNPLEILKDHKEIDLPSYDLLHSRFVNGDWGKKRPRTP